VNTLVLGIDLFTDRVITHFGSNYFKIWRDFTDFGAKTDKYLGKYPKGLPEMKPTTSDEAKMS